MASGLTCSRGVFAAERLPGVLSAVAAAAPREALPKNAAIRPGLLPEPLGTGVGSAASLRPSSSATDMRRML